MKSSACIASTMLIFGMIFDSHCARAGLLVYEGFDINLGNLNGQSGATSTGWLAPWDSGFFASPVVQSGSIVAPLSTVAFYNAVSAGNKVDTFGNPSAPFGAGGLADRRFMSLAGNSSLYWTVLAEPNVINGSPPGEMRLTFDIPGQFHLYARPSGPNPLDPVTWQLFLPGVIVDTGVDANQTSLLAFQLDFNGSASLVPDQFSFWVNLNPLVDAPTYQGMHDLGSTVWGLGAEGRFSFGATALANAALVDEFRIGTDWASVGIVDTTSTVPEPSTFLMFGLGLVGMLFHGWRRKHKMQTM